MFSSLKKGICQKVPPSMPPEEQVHFAFRLLGSPTRFVFEDSRLFDEGILPACSRKRGPWEAEIE